MPRPRNPNRNKAAEIFRQHDGKITNREIANQLGESEKVVAVWKQRDEWVKVVQQSNESCTTKQKSRKSGAPKGNKNAVGNIGGPGGPGGNKNAVVTGEYETISWDALDDTEKSLFSVVDTDELASIDRTIRMMEIRERRMLLRIKSLQEGPELVVSLDIKSHQSNAQYGDSEGRTTNQESAVDRIQRIEEALTRLQEKKGKYIELRSKLVPHSKRDELEQLKIDKMRAEIAKLLNKTDEEEQEDDGFMDALKVEASEVWGDGGDSDFTLTE